jgi:hypothetical protein
MLRYKAVMNIGACRVAIRSYRVLYLVIATITWLDAAPAAADMAVLPYTMRFCPSWAEAHERSLADLNHGRPPYPVKWKGCIALPRGTCVDVVEQQEQSTEIVVRGKHWITDEMPDVVAGQACFGGHSGRAHREPESIITGGEKTRWR